MGGLRVGDYSERMKILLVRHGAAIERGTPGVLDAERPLTPAGRARFGLAARGLARVVGRVDLLMTSPLARAQETAEIAAAAFTIAGTGTVIEPSLAGDRAEAIIAAVPAARRGETIALVGHEPVLGAVLAHMLASAAADRFAFRKGGAALVDLPEGLARPGRLVWFLPPRILRALGDEAGVPRVSPAGNGAIAAVRPPRA
jgi:phosphohistidine phosphatase